MKIKLQPIKPRKPLPLSPKRREFIKHYVDNGFNGRKTASAIHNVNSDAVARSTASRVLSNKNVQSGIVEYLRSKEIQDRVSDVLQEGLNANRVSDYKGTLRTTDVPDHSERRKTASLVGDFLGLKSKTLETTTKRIELTASLNDMSESDLRLMLTKEIKTLGVIP